jgi:hypothetical protein
MYDDVGNKQSPITWTAGKTKWSELVFDGYAEIVDIVKNSAEIIWNYTTKEARDNHSISQTYQVG